MIQYEIKPQGKLSLNLKELWDYRELLFFFSWRDIKVKYKQAILGFLWAILQPLFTMLIFSFFFGRVLKIPSNDIPYPVFAFLGLILWSIFSSGLSSAGNSMVANANIIKKIYFPRLIIPISSILVSIFDFLMTMIVFVPILIYYKVEISYLQLLYCLPLSLIITLISTFGIGCFIAALNVKYRDFRYILPFLVQSLLFLTPVIYPISIIKTEWVKYVLALNPMSGAINLIRSPFITSKIDINLLIISCVSALLMFIIGLLYFRKTEYYFADLA